MYQLIVTMAAQGLPWLLAFLMAAQIVAAFAGTLVGHRFATDLPPRAEATGLVTNGILALTAFVLALTLSFSTGRMAERRLGALEEANAIGTAWLQATALPDPRATSIATLLEDYAVNRLDYARASYHDPEIDTLAAENARQQSQIWAEMTTLLAVRTDPHTVSLMNSINHVFDMTTAQRLSLASGLPPQLLNILIAMVCVSAGMAGFQLGLKRQRAPVLVGILLLVWSLVIVTVMDFGAPRLGNFRTVTEPYDWTIAGFASPTTP